MVDKQIGLWHKIRISTLSYIMLIVMVFTGLFFTFAFAFLYGLIADLHASWQSISAPLLNNAQIIPELEASKLIGLTSMMESLSGWTIFSWHLCLLPPVFF